MIIAVSIGIGKKSAGKEKKEEYTLYAIIHSDENELRNVWNLHLSQSLSKTNFHYRLREIPLNLYNKEVME